MIENIDDVLLQDMLSEFLQDCEYDISSDPKDVPSQGIRIILPVEGHGEDLDLIVTEEQALNIGELVTGEKEATVNENITMTLSVILKKIGDVLSYFSEYTFGEPIITDDKAVDERTFFAIEITKGDIKGRFFVSEPHNLSDTSANQEIDDLGDSQIDFPGGMSEEEEGENNWDVVMDIPVEIVVELGKTKLTIQDVLNLVPGSVVELDKLSGESVEVLANGKTFAEGEVVVIGDNFGVRLTNIKELIYTNPQKKVA